MPGILGSIPPVAKRSQYSASIETTADTSAQTTLGQIVTAKDTSDRWSMLKYYKANSTVLKGHVLVKSTVDRDPNTLEKAGTGLVADSVKGIAASPMASAQFGWCYIAGYCPDAVMPSGGVSNMPLHLSGSNAGWLSSQFLTAGTGPGEFATIDGTGYYYPVIAWSLATTGANAATAGAPSTNSCILQGLLL